MDRLPSEIMVDVVYWACTDGGRTACALRETSRSMNMLVMPLLFRNISIYGPEKLAKFCKLFRELALQDQSIHGIEHLYITDERSPLAPVPHRMRSALNRVGSAIGKLRRGSSSGSIEVHEWSLPPFVDRCAPNLRSLTIFLNGQGRWNWFPWFQDLALYPNLCFIRAAYMHPMEHVLKVPRDLADLPALETLHIATPHFRPLQDFCRALNQSPPPPISEPRGYVPDFDRKIPLLILEAVPDDALRSFVNRFCASSSAEGRTCTCHWKMENLCIRALLPVSSTSENARTGMALARIETSIDRPHQPQNAHQVCDLYVWHVAKRLTLHAFTVSN
jgi:hypothetical protein